MNKHTVIDRRRFLAGTLCASALSGALSGVTLPGGESKSPEFDSFGVCDDKATFVSRKIGEQTKLFVMSDTHLFMDDARGEPFRSYSARMAKGYNVTKHYRTGATTNPNECFEKSLARAKSSGADAIVLLGDIVSFPSEAGIEWAVKKLDACGVPWYYISGNHDWHYEGMPGSDKDLRDAWTGKRLKPFYRGRNPLAYAVDVKGLRLVLVDDSTYEILPEQLEFFKEQVASGVPMALFMHIPLYAPGRSVGFGCGHPEWSGKTDHNWKIERREKWRNEGHTSVTMNFYRTVFTARNLIAVFTGHIHQATLDTVNGIPQFVLPANATGATLTATFSGAKSE